MTAFTKGFILGIIIGVVVMSALVFIISWQYEKNHPTEIEEIVVDSLPSDTPIYLGRHEGILLRK